MFIEHEFFIFIPINNFKLLDINEGFTPCLGILGQKHDPIVGWYATLRFGHRTAAFLMENSSSFLMENCRWLGMIRSFVFRCRVTSQPQHFGGQIIHNGYNKVGQGANFDAFRVVTLPEKTLNFAYRKLNPGAGWARLLLCFNFTSIATTRYILWMCSVKPFI